MAYPAVTNTFANSTTADATQVNKNFSDLVGGFSDGTKDLNMNLGTFAGALTASTSLVTSGISYTVPVNAGSLTISSAVSTVILDPAALIATYTLTMPATPVSGQRISITPGLFGITALTISPNSGQTIATSATISTLLPGNSIEYIYRGTTWYKISSGGNFRTTPTITYSDNVGGTNNTGAYTTTSGSIVAVTNLSTSFTCAGGPVIVSLLQARQPGLTVASWIGLHRTSGAAADAGALVYLFRGATQVAEFEVDGYVSNRVNFPPSSFVFTDSPGVGSFTYTWKTLLNTGTNVEVEFRYIEMCAYELT